MFIIITLMIMKNQDFCLVWSPRVSVTVGGSWVIDFAFPYLLPLTAIHDLQENIAVLFYNPETAGLETNEYACTYVRTYVRTNEHTYIHTYIHRNQ